MQANELKKTTQNIIVNTKRKHWIETKEIKNQTLELKIQGIRYKKICLIVT